MIHEGVVPAISVERLGHAKGVKLPNSNRYALYPKNLPPKNFRSGKPVVTKAQINRMSDGIVEYLTTYRAHSKTLLNDGGLSFKAGEPEVLAYVRGSYLEAVRLAGKKSSIEIKEFFSDDELAQLKKKGIMWMKVGLRMPTPFIIFRMKIRYMIMDNTVGQQTLF